MPVMTSRIRLCAPRPTPIPSTPAETTIAPTSTPSSRSAITTTTKPTAQRATLVRSEASVRTRTTSVPGRSSERRRISPTTTR